MIHETLKFVNVPFFSQLGFNKRFPHHMVQSWKSNRCQLQINGRESFKKRSVQFLSDQFGFGAVTLFILFIKMFTAVPVRTQNLLPGKNSDVGQFCNIIIKKSGLFLQHLLG